MKTETKLELLLAHIKAKLGKLKANKFDIWDAVESLTTGINADNDASIVYPLAAPYAVRSSNIIIVESLPESRLGYLTLLVESWLRDNDADSRAQNGLEPAVITGVNLGQGLYDVEISVEFCDPIIMKVDEAGDFNFDGTMYSVV